MKKLMIIIFITAVLLSGCGQSDLVKENEELKVQLTATTKPPINYSLLDSSKKCILDIRIDETISENEIKTLSEYLRVNEGASCNSLYIYFFLPSTQGGGCSLG